MDDLHKKFGRESLKRGSAMALSSAKKPHLGMIE
jgi:hypothetical protein